MGLGSWGHLHPPNVAGTRKLKVRSFALSPIWNFFLIWKQTGIHVRLAEAVKQTEVWSLQRGIAMCSKPRDRPPYSDLFPWRSKYCVLHGRMRGQFDIQGTKHVIMLLVLLSVVLRCIAVCTFQAEKIIIWNADFNALSACVRDVWERRSRWRIRNLFGSEPIV
jgi:hypothetical protein